MTGKGRAHGGLGWGLALLLLVGLAKTLPVAHAETPQVRALLVGVDDYGHDPAWEDLHGTHDVTLLRDSLISVGVQPSRIRTLRDAEATRDGVLAALAELAVDARGDHLLFHASAHGQQVEDVDGDEGDALDEALALYGAPATAAGGYRGERHLLDDDLGQALDHLRGAVGPTGSVTVVLDACHAASLTRSALPVRGSAPPLRFDDGSASGVVSLDDDGLIDTPFRASAEDRGPLVVLSAARPGERAHETLGSDRETLVGALSAAVAAALRDRPELTTWGDLHDVVSASIQGSWPDQHPTFVGPRDLSVFGHDLREPTAAIPLRRWTSEEAVVLAGGRLHGLGEGARVEVHRAGTRVPAPGSRLVGGRVTTVEAFSAQVALDGPLSAGQAAGARAFVTTPGVPPPLGVAVWLAPDLPGRTRWRRALDARPFVHPVEAAGLRGDHLLEATPTQVVLRPLHDLDAALARQPRGASPSAALLDTLSGLGRTAALRQVHLRDAAHRVQVEVQPARPTGPDTCAVAGPPAPRVDGRHRLFVDPTTRAGSARLDVTLRGEAPSAVTVVAVDGRGWTCQLAPAVAEAHAHLRPGDTASVCLTPDLDPGESAWEGEIWVLATSAEVDLGRVMGRSPGCGADAAATRGQDALRALLDASRAGLRGTPDDPAGGFSVVVPLRVEVAP